MQPPVTRERGERGSEIGVEDHKGHPSKASFFKHLLTTLKILAGIALLVLSIQGIQWENLVTGIHSAKFAWLALAVASVLLGLFLKVWRWAIFVKNYHIQTTNSRLFSSYFVGQAVNILLPSTRW